MSVLLDSFAPDTVEMRQAYCDALIAEAKVNDKLMVVDADVSHSVGTGRFYAAFPERAVNCGIMEAQAVGMSAGLSATGLVPFFHAFGVFATRRVFDQLFLSCAYQDLNVKIIGADPGVTAATNGGTHMPFEDMAVLRAIPDITLIEPCDPVQLADTVRQLADVYGVYYLRMARKSSVSIYEEGSTFQIGKGNLLRNGTDVTIIASGIMVAEALKAARMLEADGVSARVVDMFTWKPIDTELIAECAEETGAIVTAENHNIYGGLGSAVAEACVKTVPVPVETVGTDDRFGQVGTEDFLRREYALTAERIAEAAKKAIERK